VFRGQKSLGTTELEDSLLKQNLFFLCDITSHLNNLSIKLQGKGELIFYLAAINGFQAKLKLEKSTIQDVNGTFSNIFIAYFTREACGSTK